MINSIQYMKHKAQRQWGLKVKIRHAKEDKTRPLCILFLNAKHKRAIAIAATQGRHFKWLNHHIRLTVRQRVSRAQGQETEGPVKQLFMDSLAQSRQAWPGRARLSLFSSPQRFGAKWGKLTPVLLGAKKPSSRCRRKRKKKNTTGRTSATADVHFRGTRGWRTIGSPLC